MLKFSPNFICRPEHGYNQCKKFEQIWLTNEEHYNIDKKSWLTHSNSITDTLSHTLTNLHSWGKANFGCIPKKIQQARQDLQSLTNQTTNDHMLAIRDKEKELDELLRYEEIWWSQRSRALWLKHGDKNTSYFHQKPIKEGDVTVSIKSVTPRALPTMNLLT
jgi:hypothetical protein